MLWNFTEYNNVLTATDARILPNLVSLIRFNSNYVGNQNRIFSIKGRNRGYHHFGFEVHNTPGFGFLEIVYKDALEFEFTKNDILFAREKEYIVQYKDSILRHKFYAISSYLIRLFLK